MTPSDEPNNPSCLGFFLRRRPPLLHHPGEEAAIVDAPGGVLAEEPVLVLADAVQHLPLRRRARPSCVVAGLPVRGDQLVHLGGRQGVGHRLGVLGERRLELVRDEPSLGVICA